MSQLALRTVWLPVALESFYESNEVIAHLKYNVNRVVILDIDLHHGRRWIS